MTSYLTMTSYIRFRLIRVTEKYTFYWCIDFEKFFSVTYWLAELFERPS